MTDPQHEYLHPGYKKPYPIETVLRDLAAQEGCDGEPYDAMVFAAAAITTLRAQLAEARAELHGPIKQLSAHDHANIIAHLSLELEPNGVLPNRNSLMMALVEVTNAARKDAARADRAEAALAAQIEAGAVAWVIPGDDLEDCNGFIDAMAYEHGEFTRPLYVAKPHDRTALDRHDAKTREKALREAAEILDDEGWLGMSMHRILALIEAPK